MNKKYRIIIVLLFSFFVTACSKDEVSSTKYNTTFQTISSGAYHQIALDISEIYGLTEVIRMVNLEIVVLLIFMINLFRSRMERNIKQLLLVVTFQWQ